MSKIVTKFQIISLLILVLILIGNNFGILNVDRIQILDYNDYLLYLLLAVIQTPIIEEILTRHFLSNNVKLKLFKFSLFCTFLVILTDIIIYYLGLPKFTLKYFLSENLPILKDSPRVFSFLYYLIPIIFFQIIYFCFLKDKVNLEFSKIKNVIVKNFILIFSALVFFVMHLRFEINLINFNLFVFSLVVTYVAYYKSLKASITYHMLFNSLFVFDNTLIIPIEYKSFNFVISIIILSLTSYLFYKFNLKSTKYIVN
jgi:hypothetical protein